MWCTSTQPASARRPETRWRFHLSRCPGFGVHFYLLTALAAAVLLAASSGTAYAQSIGFDKTSGSVMEKAFIASGSPSSKHPPLELKVRASGLPPVGDSGRADALLRLGVVSVAQGGADVAIYLVRPTKNGQPQGSAPLGEDGAGGEMVEVDPETWTAA